MAATAPTLTRFTSMSLHQPLASRQKNGINRIDDDPPNRIFPSFPSGMLQSHTAIAPWSEYKEKLKNEQQLAAARHYSRPTIQKPFSKLLKSGIFGSKKNFADNSTVPVIIKLEPNPVLSKKQILKPKNYLYPAPKHDDSKLLNRFYISSYQNRSAFAQPEKPTYSTATNQYLLPKSITQQRTKIQPQKYTAEAANRRIDHTLYPNSVVVHEQRPDLLINRPFNEQHIPAQLHYYNNNIRKPTSTQIRGVNTIQVPLETASNALRPLTQYSRLVPPGSSLPVGLQSSNIANSIFAQSQIRQTPPAALPLNDITSAGSNIASFLTSEHVVEDISKIARNLLSLPGPAQQELFSTLTSAITGSKQLLSGGNGLGEETVVQPSNIVNTKDLFSSLAEKHVETMLNTTNATETEVDNALKNMPVEERALLEAAIQSGELEKGSVLSAFQDKKNITNKLVKQNSNRLLEWIQQNRPRPSNSKQSVKIPSDKLPYYGKYCGSFVEQQTGKKKHDVTGAVWAVDDHRFIVSKFHFIPGSVLTENVTFWAGPANITADSATDMTPNNNGFYLHPEPIDIMTFLTKEIKRIDAKIRRSSKANSSDSTNLNNTVEEDAAKRHKREHSADANEEPMYSFLQELSSEIPLNDAASDNAIRVLAENVSSDNLFETIQNNFSLDDNIIEVHEHQANVTSQLLTSNNSTYSSTTTNPDLGIVVTDITVTAKLYPARMDTTTAIDPTTSTITSPSTTMTTAATTTESITTTSDASTANNILADIKPSSALTANIASKADSSQTNEISPLGWYAGFQPLLLTLPNNKWLKNVYWLALRDHKAENTVASVLIPNGPAFKIPAIVQLRPLTSNGVCTVTSGPIMVLDTKTIEINDLTFICDGVAAWFMIGKDILPNENGDIVPMYNKKTNDFDCDSLPTIENQTVTLRLPGLRDIKDVFWFSIFSINQGVSLSHIYLPYNDMQLPPDLNGIATPECVWRSS
uniref:DM13 domain-containing protein n=1 Tax=Syphacia muris TaxID=451379 RepID=A0A0N5AKW8_9BILA